MGLDLSGFGAVASAAGSVINKVLDFIPDPTLKAQAEAAAQAAANENIGKVLDNAMAQVGVNQTEAASLDKYKSYARPTFLYLGAVILGMRFLILPFTNLVLTWFHSPLIAMPDEGIIIELIFGLLGIYGTQRTVEKVKGVA